jgi:serine/threonine protein kinase
MSEVTLLDRGVDHHKEDVLQLKFHAKGTLALPLDCFSHADSNQLLHSIDAFASKCMMPPALVKQIENLDAGAKQELTLSFTQIWEQDLGQSLGSTTFLPLEMGTYLQDHRIRIIQQLAGNGRTASYLARYLEQQLVVVKEIAIVTEDADMTAKKTFEQFQRECSHLLSLRHPKLSRLLDHFVENGRSYLILEFVPGMDLREHVKRVGACSEQTVLDWALQISNIIEYLHSNEPPIIHRDITPDNLILGDDGCVHLIDFGAARELVTNATGTLVGKQAYMAPEQLRGRATVQSDIYSLGATFYFLATGEEPAPLTKLAPRDLCSALSEDFDKMVAGCTDPQAVNRYTSVSELVKTIVQLREPSCSHSPQQALGLNT